MHYVQVWKLMILNTFFSINNVLIDKMVRVCPPPFIKPISNGGRLITLLLPVLH